MMNLYRERAHLVAMLARMAQRSGYATARAHTDAASPDWSVIYIDTPEGQMSWHLSPDDLDLFPHVPVVEPDDDRVRWDGHTTEEKYDRLARLIQKLEPE